MGKSEQDRECDKMTCQFLAHYRQEDGTEQSLEDHLIEVASKSRKFAAKINMATIGELVGLLHDLGKYSHAFQMYIRSGIGQINPDEDEYVDAKCMKGKIDHSTAGAQYIWNVLKDKTGHEWHLARQIMALCIASHHSGLINCLAPDGKDEFSARMNKSQELVHLDEILRKIDRVIQEKISGCIKDERIKEELGECLKAMTALNSMARLFSLGMVTRFVFSALIDADRLDSAHFEVPLKGKVRRENISPRWAYLIDKLEHHIANFQQVNSVDKIRSDISKRCAELSLREKGLYLLTVPTGGGKTLASLRYALLHANYHKMERIVYVIPYTSIIDQNAAEVRSIFEDYNGSIVLEHHSNLTPEKDTWKSKLLSENWDAPIVFTTAVQFLEALFASGTRGVRRMHQLANAVIIFDEIQTIPIRTIHMFNNAVNFLVSQCGASVLFCTATQPLLDQVDKAKGAAQLSTNPELMADVHSLFRELRRVNVVDNRKKGGWTDEEITLHTLEELKENGSVLVIVNTKAAAQGIYKLCKEKLVHESDVQLFHLSTNMCPAHRMSVFETIKGCLNPTNPKPVICISTQLIEAGVNIDFGCVIRYLAGLDSIAQAAGRCNRHGLRKVPGKVYIVNPANENLPKDIGIAKEKAERVLDEFLKCPEAFDFDVIGPKTIELYYKYYFFDRADEMVYPLNAKQIGRDGNLLSLLSTNEYSIKAYKNALNSHPPYGLRQSFKTAGQEFAVIDAPTEGVIVPYGEGEQIIKELCGAFDVQQQRALLKRAQRYSVNIYPNNLQELMKNRCVREIQEGSGILYLDTQYYSDDFGVSLEIVEPMKFLYV